MEADYAAAYSTLYNNHWWWRAREAFVMDALSVLHIPAGSAILDIGCGDGLMFDRLAEIGDVEGVESDGASVSTNGRWADRIRVQTFDESFDPGRTYALVLLLDVLEHLDNPVGCLRRAIELLDADGTLVITVPSFRVLWTSHDDMNHHVMRYTRRQLDEQVSSAGGRVQASRYFFHWMFVAKLVERAREAVFGATARPPGIPPHFVNEALRRFSRFEQRAFSRFSVPFGGSLLAFVASNR
jgi:SAM-dependent methyltransferase